MGSRSADSVLWLAFRGLGARAQCRGARLDGLLVFVFLLSRLGSFDRYTYSAG